MAHRHLALLFGFLGVATAFACSSTTNTGVGTADAAPPNDDGGALEDSATTPDAAPEPVLVGCTKDPGPPPQMVDPNAATDPTGGAALFTLAQALAGFPSNATGKLTAAISTEKSVITCELFETAAPASVANFVGLARGTRPYKDSGKWKVGRFYDGLTWHRVIPGFVIQGGDPLGTGTGGPGYDLVVENHVDEPLGALAMAATSPTKPSGCQFYVVVGTGPAADYNVFGTCTTDNAIAIAKVPRDSDDMPTTPVHMTRIDIGRCP